MGGTSEVKLKAWDAVGKGKFTSPDLQPVVEIRFCFSWSLDFVTFHFHKSRGGELKTIQHLLCLGGVL